MGKPRSTNRNGKDNFKPFAVKKTVKKTKKRKKKDKPSLEFIDKTFSDLQRDCDTSKLESKSDHSTGLVTPQDTNKLDRISKTDFTSLDELVKETAHTKI